jgi:hypothetical protein
MEETEIVLEADDAVEQYDDIDPESPLDFN